LAEQHDSQTRTEIDSRYLERRIENAVQAEERFCGLFFDHAHRLAAIEPCLDRFRSSVEALRQQPTGAALGALEACHNELSAAEELLAFQAPPFSLIEYEPPLPGGDQRIDFRATNDVAVWFIEVKTIRPELKDRWEQYEKVVHAGHIADNVMIHFEKEWLGGKLWHQKFAARGRMLEYSLDFEDRIRMGGVDSPRNGFVLALFSDGFAWHEDELEDFVAFYRTGRHRLDDGLAKMEQHALKGKILTRRISTFAYFCRPAFEARPTVVHWNVRPPSKPWLIQ
jgi:hypothetical protein